MPEPAKSPALPRTSSIPTEVPEEQATLFRDVLTVLEEKRVPYAVSGAFALRQHTGICRFTKDLDLFMTARTAGEVYPYLRERDFECEVLDPVWLGKLMIPGLSEPARQWYTASKRGCWLLRN